MNFTVIWRPKALAELAELWAESLDRSGMTAASHRIDLLLQSDPTSAGEGRGGDDRLVFDSPLAVWFRVDASARMAFVLSVGPSRG